MGVSFVTCVCLRKLPATCTLRAALASPSWTITRARRGLRWLRPKWTALLLWALLLWTPHAELATNMPPENQHVAHAREIKKKFHCKPSHMLGEDDPTD